MKTLTIVFGMALASAFALSAQEVVTPKYEVGLTYSGFHATSQDSYHQVTANGGAGSFAYNINKWVGVVADLGGYANTNKDGRAFTYLFGPRFSWRHSKFTPYCQFLFGGAYTWTDVSTPNVGTQNSFATAAGGGIDYNLTKLISIKPVQVEYLMTQFNSTNGFGTRQNDVRYSAGITLKFGER